MFRSYFMKLRYLFGLLVIVHGFSACRKDANNVVEQLDDIRLNKVIFTDPEKVKLRKENSTEIFDELIRYFESATKESTVHVNIYLLDYTPIINAIVKAHERGVKISILVDRSRDESIQTNVVAIQYLQAKLLGNSSLSIVNNDISMGSSGSINHLKYVLFSELHIKGEGIAKNVVFSTSSNFTAADMKKVQDAVVISDDDLYVAFKTNWEAVLKYAEKGMSAYNYQTFSLADGDMNAYFFPRRLNNVFDGRDNIIEILDKISDYSSTSIQIAMSDWSDTRINIAQKLIELKDKGVKVEVIAKSSSGVLVQAELKKLKAKGAYVTIVLLPVNIHAKFMLVEGTWNSLANTKLVVTGSHNFTSNALKVNNEVLLLLRNNILFADYKSYYQKLKSTF